jgi:hypothetical protein
MSDGGRGRASRGVNGTDCQAVTWTESPEGMGAAQPYQSVEVISNVGAQRSAVRSIAWLDGW